MSKYGGFSDPYFPVFGQNKGNEGPEKNSLFGHFSRSGVHNMRISSLGPYGKNEVASLLWQSLKS